MYRMEYRQWRLVMGKFPSVLAGCLRELSLEQGADGDSGDVESPTGWFAWFAFPRPNGDAAGYVLREDSQGFVDLESFDSADDAMARFDALDEEYGRWLDGEEGEAL